MNDWYKSEPSFGPKLLFALGLVISVSASIWSAGSAPADTTLMARFSYFCVLVCIGGCLVFFWSAISAYFIKKWQWSHKWCFLVGVPFFVVGSLLFLFAHSDRLRYFGSFTEGDWILVAYVTRRLAFPHLTDKQAAEPTPPLSLFPK
jgi:hypothetical protein